MLDSGYLTYYVDELDEPPYGRDRKGQLCLAGYRTVHSGTQGKNILISACLSAKFSNVSLITGATNFDEKHCII